MPASRRKAFTAIIAICVFFAIFPGFLWYRQQQTLAEMKALSHQKDLTTAVGFYLTENNFTYPNSIEDIRPYLKRLDPLQTFDPDFSFDNLMQNPATGDNPGFINVKPTLEIAAQDMNSVPVLFRLRNGVRDDKLPIGYASGSVR